MPPRGEEGSTVETAHFDNPTIVRSIGAREFVRVNREFVDQLGLSGEELETRPLLDWIHPDDRRELERTVSSGDGCASRGWSTAL